MAPVFWLSGSGLGRKPLVPLDLTIVPLGDNEAGVGRSLHHPPGVFDNLLAFRSLEWVSCGRSLGQTGLQDCAEGTISSVISYQVFALGLF